MTRLVASRYRPCRSLGSGGMGDVVLAEDTWRRGLLVALKRAPRDQPSARRALEREFRLLGRLRHPNVIATHDFGHCEETGDFYFTMEHVDGRPLVEATAAAPLAVRARSVVELCRALDYVHSRRLVHGDVKSDNVLVSTMGTCLVDFGLAAPIGARAEGDGSLSGTLTHLAPELSSGTGHPSVASDLYALGVTLHGLFAGKLPFTHEDPLELTQAHRREPVPSLEERCPELPPSACGVVERLMAKDPSARPRSALEVSTALLGLCPGESAESEGSLLAHARSPEIVEQEAAVAAVDEAIAAIRERRGAGRRCVLITGAAGTGKSDLLERARTEAQLAAVRVFRGRAEGEREPYAPLVDLVREGVRVLGTEHPTVTALAPELVKLAPELSPLTGADPSPPLAPHDERLRLGEAAWSLWHATGPRPLLFVLDDLHELTDDAAWLLAYLVRKVGLLAERGAPSLLAIVGAAREAGEASPLARAVAEFERWGRCERATALTPAGTDALLALLFPDLVDRDSVAGRARAAVGGNAQLTERWAAALIRAGALDRDLRGWTLSADHAALAATPRDMRAAAVDALGQLSAGAREVLVLASLLPEGEGAATLSRLLGREPASVDVDLDELERVELLQVEVRPSGRWAHPPSSLLRAACESVAGDRAELAARALGAAGEADLLPWAARAELAEAAGDAETAGRHWARALEEAQRRGDAVRAAAHAERLAGVTAGRERRSAWRARAEALLRLDRVEEADALTERAAADGGADETGQAALEFRVAMRRGRYRRAVERARRALREADDPWRAELDLARALSSAGSDEATDRMEALVGSARSPEAARDALLLRGADRLRRGQLALAREDLLAAVRRAQAAPDPAVEAAGHNNLGVTELRAGRLAAAARHLARAAALRRDLGARDAMASSLTNLGLLELERGHASAAERHLAAALAVKEEVGDAHGCLLTRVNLAVAALGRDDVAAYRRQRAAAAGLLRECDSPSAEAVLVLADVEADWLVGDLPAARRGVRELERWVEEERFAGHAPSARLLAGLVLTASGEEPEGLRLLRDESGRSGSRSPADRADAASGLAEALLGPCVLFRWTEVPDPGRVAEATAAARRAVKLAESCAAVAHRARACLALAAASAAAGRLPAAERWLGEAAEAAQSTARSSVKLDIAAGRAWLAGRRERFAEAEREAEAGLRLIRRWQRRIPPGERSTFLADPRRLRVRELALDARRRHVAAIAGGDFFAPLGRRPRAAAKPPAAPRAGSDEAGRLREILDITRHVNALVPVDELLERILESAMGFVDAERGFIVLSSGSDLRFAVSRDRAGREVPEARFAVSRSVLAEVVRTRRPVLSSDARSDARFTSKESVYLLDLHSVLVAPLVAQETVIGALYVDNSQQAGAFDERDRDLLSLLAAQAAVAVENARLHATRLDKERLDREMTLARQIQEGLLPRRLPESRTYRLAATMEPAREIGGDYYDCIELPGGGVRLAVGDVSGKGLPAGLVMVMAQALLRALGRSDRPLDAVLAEVNDLLEEQVEDDTFVTMLLAEPATDGRSLRLCLAGHDPPVLYRAADGRAELLPAGGLALGMFPAMGERLEERELAVGPGDVLACYSDGVTECRAPDGEFFGRERLMRLVADHAGEGAPAVLEAVTSALERFRGAGERTDDVTLFILEFTGEPPEEAA